MSINNGFYILQVVTLYWIVSISMVYLNKVILSAYDSTIPAPIFVTWFQCAITCLICIVFGEIGERSRQKGGGSYFDSYPIVKYNVASGVSVMPLSIVFVGMIALNNLCLKYVEVSFYNVARSLSIVFNVLFTFIILGERTSILTCSTLVIVLYGFYIGIEGEVNFSLFGTVAGVLASVFVSLNSIFTAKVLPKVQNDKSLLLYYNNVNALVLFAPLIIAFEYQVMRYFKCWCLFVIDFLFTFSTYQHYTMCTLLSPFFRVLIKITITITLLS